MEWILANDPERETWKRLKEYANQDIAMDLIAAAHGAPTDKTRANHRKQALQLRQSLLQAEEYFSAARVVTMYTQPNLLYYGLASLASAVMLLRGNGTKSLDRLRADPLNRSHGLRFSTDVRSGNAATNLTMLENSWIEVSKTGHFLNWYDVMPSVHSHMAEVTTTSSSGAQIVYSIVAAERTLDTADIVGRKWSLLALIKQLPDLALHYRRMGIEVIHSRVNHEVQKGPSRESHSWRLHGAFSNQHLLEILEGFKFPANRIDRVSWREGSDHSGIVGYQLDPRLDQHFEFPTIRYTHDLRGYMFAQSTWLHEFVELYLATFGLSMLARYFPDLWVTCIDSHCRAAKLVEALLSIVASKAPVLALSLLRNEHVVVATYRAPWHI